MAMRDEVKEQQNKLKGKSFKEKMEYFWYYYKVHTIAAVFVIIVGAFFIKDAVTAKDYAFSATLLNSFGGDTQEAFETDFAAYAGIDTEEYNCYIDITSTLSYETMSQMDLAVSQRITAMTQTDSLDVLISDADPFTNFSQGMMFMDLRDELTPEEFKKFEKDFFYIDGAVLEADTGEMVYDEYGNPVIVDPVTDHTNPDTMEDPIPVGIYLKDSARLEEWSCYTTTGGTPIFGFVYSSNKKDYAHLFLKYLTE